MLGAEVGHDKGITSSALNVTVGWAVRDIICTMTVPCVATALMPHLPSTVTHGRPIGADPGCCWSRFGNRKWHVRLCTVEWLAVDLESMRTNLGESRQKGM